MFSSFFFLHSKKGFSPRGTNRKNPASGGRASGSPASGMMALFFEFFFLNSLDYRATSKLPTKTHGGKLPIYYNVSPGVLKLVNFPGIAWESLYCKRGANRKV